MWKWWSRMVNIALLASLSLELYMMICYDKKVTCFIRYFKNYPLYSPMSFTTLLMQVQ